MVTIGDVFSVIAAIFAVCLSSWALMLATTLLFPQKTQVAQNALTGKPWMSFFGGLILLIVGGGFGVALSANPIPGVKLFGAVILLALLSVAVVGAGGLSFLIGQRMQPMDPSLSAYKAVGRGAAIVVTATLLPFVGWWVFTPVVLAMSLGAGVSALLSRQPSVIEVAQ
ncbi:MAG TPA: hypothetical protein PLX06_00475 [Fimbriimonadaceae bacterium]|nr:hypothetical protein [Fimbriimonadaceae bacterium]